MDTAVSQIMAEGALPSGDSYRVCHQPFEQGEGTACVHFVLPGVVISRLDWKTTRFLSAHHPQQKHILKINHCLKGRAECRMHDGCFQYIGEGDLLLSPLDNHIDGIELPLGYYQGMVITIDLDVAAGEIAREIPDLTIDLHRLASRYFEEDKCFSIRSRPELEHIFAGMYTIPPQSSRTYLRLKILELIIYLHLFDPAGEKQMGTYTRQQVDIVKQVHHALVEEPERRYTIEELSQRFCISATALKSHFKGVYGKSIAAYMKEYRVHVGADLLRETDLSIAEVARRMGYASQSKFTAAFKEIMGLTASDYRKQVEASSLTGVQ